MYAVIIVSMGLQILAAALALRLTSITKMRLSWISIAIGLSLMAWRRMVVFQDLYEGNVQPDQIAFPEAVAVVLSFFLCLGVATIGPYFRSLEENYKLRQESERKYRAVADLTYDWEYWLDENLHYIYVSPSCMKISGYPNTTFVEKPSLLEELLEPDDLETYRASIRKILDNKETVNDVLRIRHAGGNTVITRHIALPAYVDGVFCGIRGSFCNITEAQRAKEEVIRLNRELEHRVQVRTQQLVVANRDLEGFVYSVSHDLRAPLRHMDGFAKAVIEDYSSVLDEEGKSMLQRISSAAQEMNSLMDGLLRLSRISKKDLTREEIDISELARSVMQDFLHKKEDRKISVAIEPGIKVFGDLVLMRDILVNLIDNSLKFCKESEETKINISKCNKPGYEGFSVEDNGVGFDVNEKEKLFKVFSRLHSDKEYPGTGVGLATIHRIVQRHQGDVQADSIPGATTKFTVQVPVREELLD